MTEADFAIVIAPKPEEETRSEFIKSEPILKHELCDVIAESAKLEETADSPASGSSASTCSDTSVTATRRGGLRDRSKLKKPHLEIDFDELFNVKKGRKRKELTKTKRKYTKGPRWSGEVTLSRFDCTICGTIFTTESNLRAHFTNVHNPNNEKHECDQCDKVFTCQRYVDIHKRRTHRDVEDFEDEPYQCDICYKKFGYKASVKKHMEVFHSDVKEVFECEMCDFVTRYADSLRNHTLYVHQDQVNAYLLQSTKREPVEITLE